MISIETQNGTTSIAANGDIATLSADCRMLLNELVSLPRKMKCDDDIAEMWDQWLLDDLRKAIKEASNRR